MKYIGEKTNVKERQRRKVSKKKKQNPKTKTKQKNKQNTQIFKVKDEVNFAHWDKLLSESAVLKSNSHQLLKKI